MTIDPVPRLRRVLCTAAASAFVVMAGTSAAWAQAAPGVGHFKCYASRGQAADPSLAKVVLEDQFDASLGIKEEVEVTRPVRFCNPVEKRYKRRTASIANPNNHLTFYSFDPAAAAPTTATVIVFNQFGTRILELESADILAVPTEKQESGSAFPDTLSHFKCYFAFGKGVDEAVVGLADQFEKVKHKLLDPALFCNPVRKYDISGEQIGPIFNPKVHLVCYNISRANYLVRQLVIANQFTVTTTDIVTGPGDMLCVPSLKLQFSVD
jgi:hypothetical protein